MKKISIEHRKHLSESIKKFFKTPEGNETRRKISLKLRGRKLSEKTRKKMSIARTGQPGHHSKTEFKKGHTIRSICNNPGYLTGKAGKGRFKKGQMPPAGRQFKKADEHTRRCSLLGMVAVGAKAKKNSKIEQKVERELQRRNIYYQKQVPLCKVTIVDFYLPESRTVIYCDGDYWHSRKGIKSKDINQDVILTFNGFNVYRFTETEINKSVKRCINKIFGGRYARRF